MICFYLEGVDVDVRSGSCEEQQQTLVSGTENIPIGLSSSCYYFESFFTVVMEISDVTGGRPAECVMKKVKIYLEVLGIHALLSLL